MRPINITLPKIYPFASDKNLIVNLEEQLKIQGKNIDDREKSGTSLYTKIILNSSTVTIVTLFTTIVPVFIVEIVVILCLKNKCLVNNSNNSSYYVKNETNSHSTTQCSQSHQDNFESLQDLLKAFAIHKTYSTFKAKMNFLIYITIYLSHICIHR